MALKNLKNLSQKNFLIYSIIFLVISFLTNFLYPIVFQATILDFTFGSYYYHIIWNGTFLTNLPGQLAIPIYFFPTADTIFSISLILNAIVFPLILVVIIMFYLYKAYFNNQFSKKVLVRLIVSVTIVLIGSIFQYIYLVFSIYSEQQFLVTHNYPYLDIPTLILFFIGWLSVIFVLLLNIFRLKYGNRKYSP